MIKATTKAARDGQLENIVVLEEKKRGQPLLSDSVTADIKCYICVLRDAGGVVNTAIVLAAATGILQRKDPTSLQCNGSHIILGMSWAKYLLKTMDFAKRHATTKHVPNLHNFDGSVSDRHQGCSSARRDPRQPDNQLGPNRSQLRSCI